MINHPTELDAALQIEIYLTDMRRESLPQDIFDHLSSDYVNPTGEEPAQLPNAIYLKLSAEADTGRTCKVAMVKDLSAAPTLGANGDQRTNEEEITTKWFRMEYTDISHATTNQAYGVYARDKAPYKIFEYRVEGLSKYFKQYFGKMRRQALLERQSENLEEAPHFNASSFNINWFVPNIDNETQPVYRSNAADWVDEIVTALTAAGTGTACAATVRYFQRLEEWARTELFITPIEFEEGGDGYVFTIPTPQATWLRHAVQATSLGPIWRDAQAFPKEIRFMYPGLLGQLQGIRFVEDPRYPTLTSGGSASGAGSTYLSDEQVDYTLTAQYYGMGNADDGSSDPRDKTSACWQVGFLLGQAALCEWMPESFHWEWEYEQYDKYFGSGIFLSCGIKSPIFDITGGDDTTAQQYSSIICPFRRPPATT